MKTISVHKKRYRKLDEIGFIGTQEKRSAKQRKLDAVRTARAIRSLKSKGKVLKAAVL